MPRVFQTPVFPLIIFGYFLDFLKETLFCHTVLKQFEMGLLYSQLLHLDCLKPIEVYFYSSDRSQGELFCSPRTTYEQLELLLEFQVLRTKL